MADFLTDPYQVIKRPLITEKGTMRQELGQYLFEVDRRATKVQVAQAIQQMFNVKVKGVNTLTVKGEARRFGSRARVRKPMKKAIVTLQAGQTIDLFNQI